jgi:hypothetical protein
MPKFFAVTLRKMTGRGHRSQAAMRLSKGASELGNKTHNSTSFIVRFYANVKLTGYVNETGIGVKEIMHS